MKKLRSGVVLMPGNDQSQMNYAANTYPFRQDSAFLYYFGLDHPGLTGLIDIDNDKTTIFGDDSSFEESIWIGPQETLSQMAERAGVTCTLSTDVLTNEINRLISSGVKVHFLPQYRVENQVKVASLCGLASPAMVDRNASVELVKAVADQRSIKSDDEVCEIEAAHAITHDMYALAAKLTRPGIYEYEVVGAIEGLRGAKGCSSAFQPICTVHGEVIHNDTYLNQMKAGDLLLLDCGAESSNHYASDITRTFPVSGKFSGVQKDLYSIVLAAQDGAIAMMKPGVYFRDVHLHAARIITECLKQLGLMKGDTVAAVEAGAHALFFPHGLGHLLGLDVHDMQALGEEHVGYDEPIKRSGQFGLISLRFAKKLEQGMALTVEPGIYFIPALIDRWRSENKFTDFIDYGAIERNKGFTGIRIEDDILVTEQGSRVLGKGIPKSIEEVER
jgi:Xaa-Pro dipeptidase